MTFAPVNYVETDRMSMSGILPVSDIICYDFIIVNIRFCRFRFMAVDDNEPRRF